MKFALVILSTLAAGFAGTSIALAGTFSTGTFSSDATSGISTADVYTHAVDFVHNPVTTVTINGVPFASGDTGPQPSLNYTLSGTINSFNGQSNNLTGSIGSLDSTYLYGNPGVSETLTLSGLDDSKTYVATFYNVGVGAAGARYSRVADGQGGSILYDQNVAGNGNGSLLRNTYSPVGGSITFSWDVDTNAVHFILGDPNTTPSGNPFLLFGFTNQVIQGVPEPASMVLLATAALGLLASACRMRRVR